METHLHQTGSQSDNEENSESRESATPSQSEIFSGYHNSSNNNSDCETATSSQSEITSEYDASSEPSSREASNPSSPESGNLSVRTVYSPTPEMAIIPQNYARCHPRSQGTAGQSGDKEFTQPTKGNSSKQTPMQYPD